MMSVGNFLIQRRTLLGFAATTLTATLIFREFSNDNTDDKLAYLQDKDGSFLTVDDKYYLCLPA